MLAVGSILEGRPEVKGVWLENRIVVSVSGRVRDQHIIRAGCYMRLEEP